MSKPNTGAEATVQPHAEASLPMPVVGALFLVSGFAALVYQVVWQRALFAIYGVNIEAVTVVVTAFMLGLGLGSLAGGRISRDNSRPVLLWFGVIELCIGVWGLMSLWIYHSVGELTAGSGPMATFTLSFALVLLPTGLMGATLPLLVGHMVKRSGNVGQSVSTLYFVNTLGSALAALTTAIWLLGSMGQTGTVQFAAALNGIVGATVLVMRRSGTRAQGAAQPSAPAPTATEAVPLEPNDDKTPKSTTNT